MAKAPNPWEAMQRERKASRLALTLFAAGVTHAAAEVFDDTTWKVFEATASIKPTSDTTRQLALTKLLQMERARNEREST